MAWIECNWLHGRWGAVKAFRPDHIASQYRRFISFRCCLDRMQSCTSSTYLTICSIFDTYCTIGTNVTNQREVCLGVLGVYTVLGETTRNPTNTMVKSLDTIGTNVTKQREVCLGVYTVLGEMTRNPTNTMVKPLDSNVQLQL